MLGLKFFWYVVWVVVVVFVVMFGVFVYMQSIFNGLGSVLIQFLDSIGGLFELVSGFGEIVIDQILVGKLMVMFFGFIFCFDVCLIILFEF